MRRLVLRLASVLLLGLAACHPAPAARTGPRPIAASGPRPAYLVSQAAVDKAIPAGVDGYQGWRVSWEGSEPETVVLERFVRGRCFLRERFAAGSNGSFDLTAIPAKAAKGGGPVKQGTVLLASVLDGPAAGGQGTLERDPVGHVAWTYRVQKAAKAGQPPLEIVTQFRYDVHGCVLPRILDRGTIPPKVRPAGVAAPSSGSK